MASSTRNTLVIAVLVLAGFIGWTVLERLDVVGGKKGRGRDAMPVPVETALVTRGPMTLTRTFSGTLEARDRFVAAPKISGRVKRLAVDISDHVKKGQVVCELDNDEYVQDVAQANADLAVARANLAEAENALVIANRELDRVKTLRKRGITSDAQFDTAKTNQLQKQAGCDVARAQVLRAESALESARIRLSYTQVRAEWAGDDDERVVAERFVDEGDTVSATTSLLSIVRLNPLTGVIYITEKDYSRLTVGQPARLTTDAYKQEVFSGIISRIAPVFRTESRQARVEMAVTNPDERLKPGMFIRATIELDHKDNALIVPEAALTQRNSRYGVFVVDKDKEIALWKPVVVDIRQDDRASVTGIDDGVLVVTLGQQMLADGSPVALPDKTEHRE